jgi:hypothetical protein
MTSRYWTAFAGRDSRSLSAYRSLLHFHVASTWAVSATQPQPFECWCAGTGPAPKSCVFILSPKAPAFRPGLITVRSSLAARCGPITFIARTSLAAAVSHSLAHHRSISHVHIHSSSSASIGAFHSAFVVAGRPLTSPTRSRASSTLSVNRTSCRISFPWWSRPRATLNLS